MSAWEATLKEESALMLTKASSIAHHELPVDYENYPIESHGMDEDVIARKVKSAVKELAAKQLLTMFKELLGDPLRMLFQNAKSGI